MNIYVATASFLVLKRPFFFIQFFHLSIKSVYKLVENG